LKWAIYLQLTVHVQFLTRKLVFTIIPIACEGNITLKIKWMPYYINTPYNRQN